MSELFSKLLKRNGPHSVPPEMPVKQQSQEPVLWQETFNALLVYQYRFPQTNIEHPVVAGQLLARMKRGEDVSNFWKMDFDEAMAMQILGLMTKGHRMAKVLNTAINSDRANAIANEIPNLPIAVVKNFALTTARIKAVETIHNLSWGTDYPMHAYGVEPDIWSLLPGFVNRPGVWVDVIIQTATLYDEAMRAVPKRAWKRIQHIAAKAKGYDGLSELENVDSSEYTREDLKKEIKNIFHTFVRSRLLEGIEKYMNQQGIPVEKRIKYINNLRQVLLGESIEEEDAKDVSHPLETPR